VGLEEEGLANGQSVELPVATWPPEVDLRRGDLRSVSEELVPLAVRHAYVTAHLHYCAPVVRSIGENKVADGGGLAGRCMLICACQA
jgi:hypothetical protein